MSFSYDPSLSTDLDVVRFLLQDNVEASAEFADEEIEYWLVLNDSAGATALALARTLHAKYAKQVDREVGDLRIWYGQKARAWLQTVRQLEQTANKLDPVGIYAGGIYTGELESDLENDSLVQPKVVTGMHDFPGVPDQVDIDRTQV